MRIQTSLLFFFSLSLGVQACADESVEFVVGDLRREEGGNWDVNSSPLKRPFGIDFDGSGRMVIVELEGGRVFQHAKGKLRHIGGDGSEGYLGDGGPLAQATFHGMHNCAFRANGDLLIADSWNHCVRRVDGAGRVSTFAGTGQAGFSGDGGPASDARFDFIMCISMSRTDDVLYIADLKNRRIRAMNLQSGIVDTVAGNGRRGVPKDGSVAVEAPLVDPRAVASDSNGRIYILERGGQALRVVEDGGISTAAGDGQRGYRDGKALQAQFGSPKHLCVDDADNVYIADDQNAAVRKFDPRSETVSTVLGGQHGDRRIQLKNPHGVCWHDGWLYVVDTGHNRILRLKVD